MRAMLQVVVYDRWGKSTRYRHGGVYTPEYSRDVFLDHKWEQNNGLDRRSYGYNRSPFSLPHPKESCCILQLSFSLCFSRKVPQRSSNSCVQVHQGRSLHVLRGCSLHVLQD